MLTSGRPGCPGPVSSARSALTTSESLSRRVLRRHVVGGPALASLQCKYKASVVYIYAPVQACDLQEFEVNTFERDAVNICACGSSKARYLSEELLQSKLKHKVGGLLISKETVIRDT